MACVRSRGVLQVWFDCGGQHCALHSVGLWLLLRLPGDRGTQRQLRIDEEAVRRLLWQNQASGAGQETGANGARRRRWWHTAAGTGHGIQVGSTR